MRKLPYFANKRIDMKPIVSRLHPEELKGLQINYSYETSPFGQLQIASTPVGICSVHLTQFQESGRHWLRDKFPGAHLEEKPEELHSRLMQYFKKTHESIPFHLLGTPFQVEVWKSLLEIQTGTTSTYKDIATKIDHPKAFRAVGTAVGANPVFFVIPCHRVLPASGKIGNYRWGSELKKTILEWECRSLL
jgi:AraC family transcriptional regulator, regulatory protein of adaptative response / methylated-DNA-[protein]-cysteine methyltransferase